MGVGNGTRTEIDLRGGGLPCSNSVESSTGRDLMNAVSCCWCVLPPVSRDPPQEVLRALLGSPAVYGDGSSTAPYRAELLALPDSCVQATPA